MAFILFSHNSPWDDFQQRLAGDIRLSIFLIAGECGGLPALVWALHVLYGHHKSGGRISVLVIMLLLCDLLQLLLNPYIVTKLLQYEDCWRRSMTCKIFTSLWSGSNVYGFLLQQVVVLEGALSIRNPNSSAHVFFPCCSIIISIILFICFFFGELYETTVLLILSVPFYLLLTITSCIVTCRALPHLSDIPYRTKKPSSTVSVFVSFTMILHSLFIIISHFLWRSWYLWVMDFCLMSLRVIADPLLCVLVYRKDLSVQKETHAEKHTDTELTQIQSSDTSNTHTAQEV